MASPFKERQYQTEARNSIFEYFASGATGNPVVAMPTGTGKSIVIAEFLRTTLARWPDQRVIMLTHVKELIEQNAEKLLRIWPEAPLGIFSAGLKTKQNKLPIVFGGIQSVSKAIKKYGDDYFGRRNLILIDECHLLSPKDDTMYQYTVKALTAINPSLRIIGFTATPYRLKQGMIIENGLFTDICFDLTSTEAFNRLIASGYIAPLIPKQTNVKIDTSNVAIVGGDYNGKQLQVAVDKDDIIEAAVKEMVTFGKDRKSWLVFAAGIKNADHIANVLMRYGINSVSSHSKLSDDENARHISEFKNGNVRALVNNNKFTTGFDHPGIDMIGMLRPTMSPGLWVQMLGRGTRPFPGKDNCLVLDFAQNTKRLGPINDPVKPNPKLKGPAGEAPVKICEECGVYNHASARICFFCGAEFTFRTKIFEYASTDDLIRGDRPVVEYFEVTNVLYQKHEKTGKPPSMKVSYLCGLQMFSEWVCFEHGGYAKKNAHDWWRQRSNLAIPETTDEALSEASGLRKPDKIRVWVNKAYPEILSVEW